MSQSYYRGSVWCPYCGFTDSQMLESVMGSGDVWPCPCQGQSGNQEYDWPLNPLLIFGKNGNPRLPMEMEAALSAPPARNKIYPVTKVHPLWLQMELIRLFPETLDADASRMGLVSPWTRLSTHSLDPWEGRLTPCSFGPVGTPVPAAIIHINDSPLPDDDNDDGGDDGDPWRSPTVAVVDPDVVVPREELVTACKAAPKANRRYPPRPPRFATKKRFRMY